LRAKGEGSQQKLTRQQALRYTAHVFQCHGHWPRSSGEAKAPSVALGSRAPSTSLPTSLGSEGGLYGIVLLLTLLSVPLYPKIPVGVRMDQVLQPL